MPLASASPPEYARAYLERLIDASRTPGVQYLVLDASKIVFEFAGGWADLQRRMPMTAATIVMAYSMSKTITAAAVLRLVEAGRVRLDDPVLRYVAWLPYGEGPLVHQLLSHTAGIPNPIPLRWVHLSDRHPTHDDTAALKTVLNAHPTLASKPGTRYAYSNLGYWILGEVVARAAGQSFVSYVQDEVLRPIGAGLDELSYTIADPDRRAVGYLEKYSLMNLVKRLLINREMIGEYAGSWLSIRHHYVNGAAFGGLVGTARGFGRFLQDQLAPRSRIFDDATRGAFCTPQEVAGGRRIPMTLGWHIGALADRSYFYKEGGGAGFHCMMRLYKTPAIGTVIMANATGLNVAAHLDRLDTAFLITGPQSRPTD